MQLPTVANGFQEMVRDAGHGATPPSTQIPLLCMAQLPKCDLV